MRRFCWGVGACGCGCWLLVGVAPSLASFDPPLLSLKMLMVSLWYYIVGQATGLAPEAAGYLKVPSPVYRDAAECGMAVPNLPLCFFPDVEDSRALLAAPLLHSLSLSLSFCVCVYVRMCVCLCVCVCVFIKLHITAQSGLVILVILCHSH